MNDLLSRIESLSPSRRRLLELLSSRQKQGKTYPLSYAQQRLWFIHQLDPESPAYNMPFAIRLTGRLDKKALLWSLEQVVARHEVLRTSFPQKGGVAVQEVASHVPLRIDEINLRALSPDLREAEVERLGVVEAEQPFDLDKGPVLRGQLLCLDETDHVLLLTMHHIVGDGWSMYLMSQELGALYEARISGRPSPLEELEIQYGNFAVWQRGWLQGGVLQSQLDYWKRQLAGVDKINLLVDNPDASALVHRGKSVPVDVARELLAKLKDLATNENATLFMVLTAALHLVLARHNGVSGSVVGTPVANRNRLETEKLIGFFINTLVLRTEVDERDTFRGLLNAVRKTTLEAYDNQDMPFEKLVEEIQPVQDLSRTPLFQVLVVLQNTPEIQLKLANVEVSGLNFPLEMSKVELTAGFTEEDGELRGAIQYDVGLFKEITVERLARQFLCALQAMADEPDRPLWQISLLSGAEREKVLREWNRTEEEFPEQMVHELIEEQVRGRKQAVAMRYEEESVSYEELNRRANQMAHYLQKLGVGPEVAVGICLRRSVAMVVSVLAVMKAGGIYVPLDPEYPAARLNEICQDAGIKVLVRSSGSGEGVESEARTVLVDGEQREWEQESQSNPGSGASRENAIYVMYTSGSTGRAKGVMVTHRSVRNQLGWASRAIAMQAGERFLLKASFSFDASVIEMLLPLVQGGEIVAARAGGEQDVEYLVELVRREQINYIDLAPTLLQGMLEEEGVESWESVRKVFSGGEALSGELVREFQKKVKAELWNTYGPTETTVQSSYARGLESGTRIPIGRPVANTQIYIVNGEGEPVGVGVRGEIYIGGEGVGRGYQKHAGLTAEKFVPDGISGRRGERLYRTGDLGRWREDGQVEFAGRRDNQVKVRGYRIELGEIEAALKQQKGVREAVVVVDEGGEGGLVGYVEVCTGTEKVEAGELRKELRKHLPGYMVPAQIVFVEELPMLPNGKLDRKNLPRPESSDSPNTAVKARNEIEEILCGLWAEVLKKKHIGIHDNFFELGGHSLLLTQLVSRIRRAFAIDLPLRAVFVAPTPAELAQHLEAEKTKQPLLKSSRIHRSDRNRPLRLSYAQQRLWFLDQMEPGNAAYNIPVGVRLAGELNQPAMVKSLQEIVKRHEVLRTVFPSHAGEPVQVVMNPDSELVVKEEWVFDANDGQERAEEKLQELVLEESQRGFNLAQGPLVRAKLVHMGEKDHVLLITMHHIVSDGWSTGLMVDEFARLYEAFAQGKESPLEELAIQYSDYAEWQREWLQGDVQEEQVCHWRKQLAGAEPLELPTAYPRVSLDYSHGHRGGGVSFDLGEELTHALKAMNRREGFTVFMTLLAALQIVLSRLTGRHDVVVGAPIANRTHEQTERLIGYFVNTLPFRSDLSDNPTLAGFLARVRQTTLDSYRFQDLPFEEILAILRQENGYRDVPLFNVMLAVQNIPAPAERGVGLEVRLLPDQVTASKRDLSIYIEETANGDGTIGGIAVFNSDLFHEASISRFLEDWKVCISAMCGQSGAHISEVNWLERPDAEPMASAFNDVLA